MYFSQGATDLDFERYLQPTVRCSMSPVQSPAAERFYLEAVDAEMESPVTQAEERPLDVLATPTGNLCPRYHITIKITINAHMWFIGGTWALTLLFLALLSQLFPEWCSHPRSVR